MLGAVWTAHVSVTRVVLQPLPPTPGLAQGTGQSHTWLTLITSQKACIRPGVLITVAGVTLGPGLATPAADGLVKAMLPPDLVTPC